MSNYANGNATAFEDLYRRHKGPLYRYFLRQCGSAAESEELFQDVWLRLIRARTRYQPTAKFTTYLYTLAHNRVIDFYRQRSRALPVSYTDADPDPIDALEARVQDQPEHLAEIHEDTERLLALLTQLPEAQREAFILRQEGGLSIEQIAVATEVNAETAKSRLRYALVKLRAGMRGDP